MKFTELSYASFTGKTGSCSRFPGAAKLPDGKIVILYDDGENCDSVNHEMRIAFSDDDGKNWHDGGIMYDQKSLGFPHRFTENCKPALMDEGRLISVGFGFIRDEPESGLADYAIRHGRFPESRNTLSFSDDGGKTWSLPTFIPHNFDTALELSGPALWCETAKEVLVFGPPFVLQGHAQQGICLASGDRGKTWEERGRFFASDSIAPWEVRSMQEKSGRIWLVMWSYDLVNKIHLPNHLVYSDDQGRSWSEPLDSGIRGQAANLFYCNDTKFLLYTVREGENTGIYCAPFELSDGKLICGPSTLLWDAAGMKQNCTERIEKQFRALKFGQPSMIYLHDDQWLLLYWSCENDSYAIRTRIFQVQA